MSRQRTLHFIIDELIHYSRSPFTVLASTLPAFAHLHILSIVLYPHIWLFAAIELDQQAGGIIRPILTIYIFLQIVVLPFVLNAGCAGDVQKQQCRDYVHIMTTQHCPLALA